MSSSERTKWISFYRLRDALAAPGCAICRLVMDSSHHYLSGIFHEYVNDPNTRSWLQAANGFCNWHAWLAVRMPDTESGLGIIYETILDAIINRFADRRQALLEGHSTNGIFEKFLHSGREGIAGLLESTGECNVCLHVAQVELSYLNELLAWFDDEEMRAAFDQSFGVCLPHTDLLIESHSQHENLPPFIKAQQQKCEALREALREFLRKLEYEFADESKGEEQDSWRRVVELCVGKSRVFNSQVKRGK